MTNLSLSHNKLKALFFVIEVSEKKGSVDLLYLSEFLSQHIIKTFQSLQRVSW